MTAHTLHTRKDHPEPVEYCMVCDGGLSSCPVCGGGEGSLPTECPGCRMTADEADKVYAGVLDFKDNEWRNL